MNEMKWNDNMNEMFEKRFEKYLEKNFSNSQTFKVSSITWRRLKIVILSLNFLKEKNSIIGDTFDFFLKKWALRINFDICIKGFKFRKTSKDKKHIFFKG